MKTKQDIEELKNEFHLMEELDNEFRSILDKGVSKVVVEWKDGSKNSLRLFKSENDRICFFKKRSSKSGFEVPMHKVKKVSEVKSRKTEAQKWEDKWNKVKNKLEKSGLWENILEEINIALEIGYDRLQELKDEYEQIPYGKEREKYENDFLEKHPILKVKYDGKVKIRTTVLWNMSVVPKVKKMNFHKSKDANEFVHHKIQFALDHKEDYRESGYYQYDKSFHYVADANKAFYSEEYRGCGNGHYYLALDATHALFMEDD